MVDSVTSTGPLGAWPFWSRSPLAGMRTRIPGPHSRCRLSRAPARNQFDFVESRDDVALAVLKLRRDELGERPPVQLLGGWAAAIARIAPVHEVDIVGGIDACDRAARHCPATAHDGVVVDLRHQSVAGAANVEHEAVGIAHAKAEGAIGRRHRLLAIHLNRRARDGVRIGTVDMSGEGNTEIARWQRH